MRGGRGAVGRGWTAGGQGPTAGEGQAAGLGRAGSPVGVDGGRAAWQPPAEADGGGGGAGERR
jgi:hypothetical protein